MSRIDEALARSRATSGSSLMPAQDWFTGAWKIDGQQPGVGDVDDNHNGPGKIDHEAVAAASRALGPDGLFRGFSPDVAEKLVLHREHGNDGNEHVMSALVEQHRRLAATLHNGQIDHGAKAVMITSAVPGEGKTLTATNLALTLSESYRRRVLLIDADLRRPALHHVFNVPNVAGLNDGPKEQAEWPLPLLEITRQLTLLPAGQSDADPMGVLTSPRTQRVIEEGRARFDWVILDAPPVGLLTDANLLAKMVDATLLVVAAASTDYGIVRRAIDAVGRERILGVVLNRVDAQGSVYGYKYHAYYTTRRAFGHDAPHGPR